MPDANTPARRAAEEIATILDYETHMCSECVHKPGMRNVDCIAAVIEREMGEQEDIRFRALRLACDKINFHLRTCPYDAHDWCIDDSGVECATANIVVCWMKYFEAMATKEAEKCQNAEDTKSAT